MFLFDWERVWGGSDIAITLTQQQRAILLLFASSVNENPEQWLLNYPALNSEDVNDWSASLVYALLNENSVPTILKSQDYYLIPQWSMIPNNQPLTVDNANSIQGGNCFQNPSASNDTLTSTDSFFFRKGNWSYYITALKFNAAAKIDLKLGIIGTGDQTIFTATDLYNATTVNTKITGTFDISDDCNAFVKVNVNGRNAANTTGYQVRVGQYIFHRLGD